MNAIICIRTLEPIPKCATNRLFYVGLILTSILNLKWRDHCGAVSTLQELERGGNSELLQHTICQFTVLHTFRQLANCMRPHLLIVFTCPRHTRAHHIPSIGTRRSFIACMHEAQQYLCNRSFVNSCDNTTIFDNRILQN